MYFKIQILLIVGLCGSFSACVRYFPPAMYLQGETYLSKPFLPDSAAKYQQSLYVTGHLATSVAPSILMSNSTRINSGSLQIHQAHSFKFFNVAYGVLGSIGNAAVPPPFVQNRFVPYLPQDAGDKSFQALGLRFDINAKIPSNNANFEWRALGLSLGRFFEFGQYWKFRRDLAPSSFLYYSNSPNMYSWGLHTEFCWKYVGQNKRNAIFWKIGYLQSIFMGFENNIFSPDVENTDQSRQRNIHSTFVYRIKNFEVSYHTHFFPFPLLAGLGQSVSLSANLSGLLGKKK